MVRLQLVIPCYNEAARLDTATFVRYVGVEGRVAFLFVNDGSSDDTSRILHELEAQGQGRVRAMDLPKNMGKAAAVRSGILAALAQQPELVGFWDADLSTPLDAIQDFLDVIDAKPDVDIVMGARVALLGRQIQRVAWRHYLGRAFATAASLTLGLAVYDTQCGAKVFRVSDALRQAFAEPFTSKWVFDVELLSRYIGARGQAGIESRIYELPLRAWTDVPGSKVKAVDGLRALQDLIRIRASSRTGR
jgi:glycosyltransferase involved in cell wall biosynthesis